MSVKLTLRFRQSAEPCPIHRQSARSRLQAPNNMGLAKARLRGAPANLRLTGPHPAKANDRSARSHLLRHSKAPRYHGHEGESIERQNGSIERQLLDMARVP